jgi:hypothetical protein
MQITPLPADTKKLIDKLKEAYKGKEEVKCSNVSNNNIKEKNL